jgi:proline iminopeptidase
MSARVTASITQAGNRDGLPVVLLHGGPASGSTPRQRIFTTTALSHHPVRPTRLGLQRADGRDRAQPHGRAGRDIERLREHLSIERWLVSGGSWGATLALAYASQHREHVSGVVLRGVFLAGRTDLDWYFQGAGAIVPEAHEQFMAHIPRRWQRRVLTYLDRSLSGADAVLRLARLGSAMKRRSTVPIRRRPTRCPRRPAGTPHCVQSIKSRHISSPGAASSAARRCCARQHRCEECRLH